jgi:predicted GNAT superfamily acetyltransferase
VTADDEARLAAAAAGVRVAEVGAVDALHDLAALFATIWRTSLQDPPLNSDLLRALTHIGGYVAAAWDASPAYRRRPRDGAPATP